MGRGGGNRLAARLGHDVDDLVAIGGDDDVVGDAEGAHALEDADDDGDAGQQAQGLAREARRTQPSGDDGERPHDERASRGRWEARARRAADATFTPVR